MMNAKWWVEWISAVDNPEHRISGDSLTLDAIAHELENDILHEIIGIYAIDAEGNVSNENILEFFEENA